MLLAFLYDAISINDNFTQSINLNCAEKDKEKGGVKQEPIGIKQEAMDLSFIP